MNNNLVYLILFVLFTALSTTAYSQTEGFNVKTPIEKIADSSTEFLNQIISQSKKEPKKSVPLDLACSSSCFLAIPDIEIIPSRGDFTGTGLLSCRVPNSSNFTEPIYYKINIPYTYLFFVIHLFYTIHIILIPNPSLY